MLPLLGEHDVLLVDQRALFGDDPALRLDLAFGARRRLTFGDRVVTCTFRTTSQSG